MWHHVLSKLVELLFFIEDNNLIALLFGVTVLSYILYVTGKRQIRKLPPGPFGLPFLGYYPFLGKEPEKTLSEVGKKYGDVFGLYLGPQYVVFLNNWEALKDCHSQNTSLDRPPNTFPSLPYNLGIDGANGDEWVETRRIFSKVMKCALNITRLEELVQEEVREMVVQVIQHGERPIKPREILGESFSNNMVTFILGERLKHGNSVAASIAKNADVVEKYITEIGMVNFSPMISKILQFLGFENEYLLNEKIKEFEEFVSYTVDDKIKNPDLENEGSFISLYYKEIENEKKRKKVSSYITVYSLKGAVLSLLINGSDSGPASIVWTLIAMADHPDIQRKVHEELDQVIGKDGSIVWSERCKVPYTYATLMESMRWATVVPFTGTRIASEDMQVQGYFVPKGSFIIPNSWAIHNDARYWDKPNQFIPERFLLDDRKKVNPAPESFCPFSFGKRNCPAKLIAFMEILQYFTILMQNFKVLPKEGDKVKYNAVLAFTYQATNAELRFIRRQ